MFASGKYAAVVYSVRWFLVALLLLETGISTDALREKISELQPYRHFQAQAPGMLPEVYGDATADGSEGTEPP